jgi:hypothetical protein
MPVFLRKVFLHACRRCLSPEKRNETLRFMNGMDKKHQHKETSGKIMEHQ